jgi:signal recognition particle GTPase
MLVAANRQECVDMPGPQQLRQQEQHEAKLKDIQEQVSKGKLVIRQMTPDERKLYPPRPAKPARGRKRY